MINLSYNFLKLLEKLIEITKSDGFQCTLLAFAVRHMTRIYIILSTILHVVMHCSISSPLYCTYTMSYHADIDACLLAMYSSSTYNYTN